MWKHSVALRAVYLEFICSCPHRQAPMNQSPEFKQNKNDIIVLIYASPMSSPQEELDKDLLSLSCQR